MTVPLERLAKAMIGLPRHQRLVLVRLLLDLDQPGELSEVDHLWDEEIRARVAAIDAGQMIGVADAAVSEEMAARFFAQ